MQIVCLFVVPLFLWEVTARTHRRTHRGVRIELLKKKVAYARHGHHGEVTATSTGRSTSTTAFPTDEETHPPFGDASTTRRFDRATEDEIGCLEENVVRFNSSINRTLPGRDYENYILEFENVFPYLGENVINLEVVNMGGYTAYNISKNGVVGGFGNLNFQSGIEAHLNFRFIDTNTGKLFTPDPFFLTIFDLDKDRKNIGVETIKVPQATKFFRHANTTVVQNADGSFSGTDRGKTSDNPRGDPQAPDLTGKQKEEMIAFQMPSLHTFTVIVKTSSGTKFGRNIMFSGSSTLTCPAREMEE